MAAAVAGALVGLTAGMVSASVSMYGIIKEERAGSREEALKYREQAEQLAGEKEELEQELDKERAVQDNAGVLAEDPQAWSLVLVNEDHPLNGSYVPESLTDIGEGRQVDGRIAADLEQMMQDGAAAGMSMYVTSAYRSYDRQVEIFNTSVLDRMAQGMTPLEAYQDTGSQVALPGTSEHATGLAVDIISTHYDELDERQGDTSEQQWLMAHCWEYGFILRYPPDKADITGIIYEPWHYRYVGKEAAKEITEQGLTLEEYLGA